MQKNTLMVILFGAVVWIGGLAYNRVVGAEGKKSVAAPMMGIGLVVNICCPKENLERGI